MQDGDRSVRMAPAAVGAVAREDRMQPHVEATVKALVAVAWADGKVEQSERDVIEGLLAAFQVSGDEAEALRKWAASPRTLDDIDLTELSAQDRRMLLQHAVVVTYVDGEQSDSEQALLRELAERLHVPEQEAASLLASAAERVRRHLGLLEAN